MPTFSEPLPRHNIKSSLVDGVVTVDAWGIPLMRSAETTAEEGQAHVLHRSARAGKLIRLRPGVFAPCKPWNDAYPRERHLAAALAVSLTSKKDPVFCRETALLLYGLPLEQPPGEVKLRASSPGAAGQRIRTPPEASDWPLPSEQRICIPSVWDPSVVRAQNNSCLTVKSGVVLTAEDLRLCLADTVPRLSLVNAVMVADALLSGLRSTYNGGLSQSSRPWARDGLSALSPLCVSKKAERRFGWITDFADGRSGSPGESLSRVRMHELGFQMPELQHEVFDRPGRLLGLLDFWWPELKLAGEFDGWGKYTDADSYSGQGRDAVFRQEKRRSERIQEEGIRFVRWMWDDLNDPQRLAEKLQRAGVPRT